MLTPSMFAAASAAMAALVRGSARATTSSLHRLEFGSEFASWRQAAE
jgi:hypothetical protein